MGLVHKSRTGCVVHARRLLTAVTTPACLRDSSGHQFHSFCEGVSVKRSNRLVILVGVLLAVLAFVGIVILLNQGGGRANRRAPRPSPSLVAIEDIAIGDPVTPDLAETREVAPEAVEQTRHWRPVAADRHARAGAHRSRRADHPGEGRPGAGRRRPRASARGGREGDRLPGRPRHGPRLPAHPGRPHRHRDRPGRDAHPADRWTPSPSSENNQNAPARYEAVAGLSNVRTVKTIIQDRRVLYVSQTRAASGRDRDAQRQRIGREGCSRRRSTA